jgi:hypothetical protein
MGLLGDSPEQQRQKRKNDLIAAIRRIQQENIASGSNLIGQQTQKNIASERAAAARRAAAGGFSAEQNVGGAESRALEAGGTELQRYIQATNAQASQAEIGAEQEFAERPMAPGPSDWLLSLGGAAGQIKHGIDLASLNASSTTPTSTTPEATPGVTPASVQTPMTIGGMRPSSSPNEMNYTKYLQNASASMEGIPEQTFMPGFGKKKLPGSSIVDFYTKAYK